jgi:hypothetical protein
MSMADPRIFDSREMVVEDLSACETHTPSDFRLLFANAGLSTALQLAEHYIGFVQFIEPEHFPNVDVYAEKGSRFDTVVGIGLHELSPGELLDDETPFFTRSGDVNQEPPCRRALPASDRSERGLWLSGTLMTPNCQASSHDNNQSREQSDQSARAVESEVRAGLALDFRRCGRVAGVPYLVADDRCRILRSGSA